MDSKYATGAALATAQNDGPHASAGMDKFIYVSIIDLCVPKRLMNAVAPLVSRGWIAAWNLAHER
jgi:hypothetical protein